MYVFKNQYYIIIIYWTKKQRQIIYYILWYVFVCRTWLFWETVPSGVSGVICVRPLIAIKSYCCTVLTWHWTHQPMFTMVLCCGVVWCGVVFVFVLKYIEYFIFTSHFIYCVCLCVCVCECVCLFISLYLYLSIPYTLYLETSYHHLINGLVLYKIQQKKCVTLFFTGIL